VSMAFKREDVVDDHHTPRTWAPAPTPSAAHRQTKAIAGSKPAQFDVRSIGVACGCLHNARTWGERPAGFWSKVGLKSYSAGRWVWSTGCSWPDADLQHWVAPFRAPGNMPYLLRPNSQYFGLGTAYCAWAP